MHRRIVHVIGTGTIGEPLIGLLGSFRKELGIDEITFHKRTPLLTDKSKVLALQNKGANLAVDEAQMEKFNAMGMKPKYEALEAVDRAVFSFGRDHGLFGRILSQTVIPVRSLSVRYGHEVLGFSFTPQDGNSLLSSVAAAEWFLYPDDYNERLQCIEKFIFQEI